MKRLLIPCIALTLVALGGLGATPADPATGIRLTVKPGFDGYFESISWVPLHITVSNDGPDLSASLKVSVEDSAGDVIFSRPVELPTSSRKSFFLYFAPRGYAGSVDVDLMDNNRRLTSVRISLRSIPDSDLLYGVLSDTPAALDALGVVMPTGGNAHVAQLEVEDLPPMAEAWRILDVLVVSDVDTGRLSAAQQEALAAWVTSGGHLIVAAGPTYQRTLGGLGDLMPVRVSGTRDVSLDALSDFTGMPFVAQDTYAPIAVGEPLAGARVLVHSEGVPLLVSRDLGGGRVDFLAADPNLEPLRSWADMDGLWRALLASKETAPSWGVGFVDDWYSARDAIASIPGVSLPSALQLCGFLGLYTVLIGPVNYLVLRRLGKRELAWLSIPAVVLFFSGCAYLTGFQIRGSRAIVHRLAVVQVWPDSDVAKIDALVGIWSPRRTVYDLRVGPDFLAQPLPSDYYGGFGQNVSDAMIEQGEEIVLRDVRVDVGSVRPFLLEGYGEAPHVPGELTLDLSSGGLRVSGQVRNETGFDLEDAVILAPGGSQYLGDLLAGDTATVNVPLATGYATAAPSGTMIAPGIPSGFPSPGYYPSGGYDPSFDDITGYASCYSDVESGRRCDLLSAVISNRGYSRGRGSGVYLVGWSDQAPVDISVLDAAFDPVDTAVYFFELPMVVMRGQGHVNVPPGLMTWSPLDLGTGVNASPYDLYIAAGQPPVAFRFEPLPLARLSRVDKIIVHTSGYGQTSSPPPYVWLWDWEQGDWEEIVVGWGDTSVSPADRFVGPDGAVHVRVEASTTLSQSLERIDLTLVGS